MKIRFVATLFSLLLAVAIGMGHAATKAYWISYTAVHRDTPYPSPRGPKYVLKIDSLGNVLVPPQKVVINFPPYQSPQMGATALAAQNGIL